MESALPSNGEAIRTNATTIVGMLVGTVLVVCFVWLPWWWLTNYFDSPPSHPRVSLAVFCLLLFSPIVPLGFSWYWTRWNDFRFDPQTRQVTITTRWFGRRTGERIIPFSDIQKFNLTASDSFAGVEMRTVDRKKWLLQMFRSNKEIFALRDRLVAMTGPGRA